MTTRYVAPDGKTTNAGTEDSPWPLAEVLGDAKRQFAQPGDEVRILAGLYRWPERAFHYGFRWAVQGEPEGGRIDFRAMGRVEVDGGIFADEKATPRHSRLFGVECYAAENIGDDRYVDGTGSDTYRLLKRPSGNINLATGFDLHVVNCTIHDASSGIGFWKTVGGESSLYGNVIFNNGWRANDRRHGHGIYAQNSAPGWKTIARNIFTRSWQQSCQVYGSDTADCDRFRYVDNVSYRTGAVLIQPLKRSRGLVATGNLHYDDVYGIGINNYDDVTARDNVGKGGFSVRMQPTTGGVGGELDIGNNLTWQVGWSQPRLDGKIIPIPDARAWLHVNAYDANRATLTVHDYKRAGSIDVSLAGFAEPGDVVRFHDPTFLHAEPRFVVEVTDQPVRITLLDAVECFVAIRETDPCYNLRQEYDRLARRVADLESQLAATSGARDQAIATFDMAIADLRSIREIVNRWR